MTIIRKETTDTIPILTNEIKNILNAFSRSRTIPASSTNRVSTALMVNEGLTSREISVRSNMHYNNIGGWRSRFSEALPYLWEAQEFAPDKLSDEVKEIFSDRSHPGCPCIFTQEQIMKVIDLAYKASSGLRCEVSQWGLNLPVRKIHRRGIAQDVSAGSVSHFLEGSQIKTP